MKALLILSIVATLPAAPAFAGCVAPINEVKIPNGNKATMEQMVAANYALQANTTEVDAYFRCLKAEQIARVAASGPEITDEQKAKIAAEYAKRQNTQTEKLQSLADRFDAAERSFRAKQAATKSAEEADEEAAAVNSAERDADEKARHDAAAQKADERAEKPRVPKSN